MGQKLNYEKLIRILYIQEIREISFLEPFCQYVKKEENIKQEHRKGELGLGKEKSYEFACLCFVAITR